MLRVDEVLDRAKERAGLKYDKDLSEHLGLSHGAVSNWRKGRALPDVVTCEKLAVLCGFAPLQVIAAINEQRAISAAEKKVWRRLAAAIFVSLVVALPAYAGDLDNGRSVHYAKYRLPRWVTMRVTRWLRALWTRYPRAWAAMQQQGGRYAYLPAL